MVTESISNKGPNLSTFIPSVIENWKTLGSVTPVGWTNAEFTGTQRRVGDTVEVRMRIRAAGGLVTAADCTFGPISGLSVDTSKMLIASPGNNVVGYGKVFSDLGVDHAGEVRVVYDSGFRLIHQNATLTFVNVDQDNPVANFGSTSTADSIYVEYRYPVLEWA